MVDMPEKEINIRTATNDRNEWFFYDSDTETIRLGNDKEFALVSYRKDKVVDLHAMPYFQGNEYEQIGFFKYDLPSKEIRSPLVNRRKKCFSIK